MIVHEGLRRQLKEKAAKTRETLARTDWEIKKFPFATSALYRRDLIIEDYKSYVKTICAFDAALQR